MSSHGPSLTISRRAKAIPEHKRGAARHGLPVGRPFGIPVYLHVSWFVVVGLISWSLAQGYFPARYPELPTSTYWVKGLSATLLLFASVLAHEFGHALVARRRGVEVDSITLFIFGGVASLSEEPRTGGDELRIAAAGPAVSLLAAVVFYGMASATSGTPEAVARLLTHLNVVLVAFNLVPAFPLDGGRILRAVLWSRQGRARATRTAVRIGGVFGWALIVYGAIGLLAGQIGSGLWSIVLGWFLRSAGRSAYDQVDLEHAFAGVSVADVAGGEHLVRIPAGIRLSEAVDDFFVRRGRDGFAVEEGGEIVGLIGLEDLRRVERGAWEETDVREAMRAVDETAVIDADEDIVTALRRLVRSPGHRLLVRRADGTYEGLVTYDDVVRRWQMSRELT